MYQCSIAIHLSPLKDFSRDHAQRTSIGLKSQSWRGQLQACMAKFEERRRLYSACVQVCVQHLNSEGLYFNNYAR